MSGADRFELLEATRIVADPSALDRIEAPDAGYLIRLAPDDLLVLPALDGVEVDDPHAIVEPECGFAGARFGNSDLASLQSACEWEFPDERPALAQGHLAGVPVKMLFSTSGVLILIPTGMAHTFQERLKMYGWQS